jgi:hypothetical protein
MNAYRGASQQLWQEPMTGEQDPYVKRLFQRVLEVAQDNLPTRSVTLIAGTSQDQSVTIDIGLSASWTWPWDESYNGRVRMPSDGLLFDSGDDAIAQMHIDANEFCRRDRYFAPARALIGKDPVAFLKSGDTQIDLGNLPHRYYHYDQCGSCGGSAQVTCPTYNCLYGKMPCMHCHDGKHTCYSCGGSGGRTEFVSNYGGQVGTHSEWRRCVSCGGSGREGQCGWCFGTHRVNCTNCGGSGNVSCNNCGATGYRTYGTKVEMRADIETTRLCATAPEGWHQPIQNLDIAKFVAEGQFTPGGWGEAVADELRLIGTMPWCSIEFETPDGKWAYQAAGSSLHALPMPRILDPVLAGLHAQLVGIRLQNAGEHRRLSQQTSLGKALLNGVAHRTKDLVALQLGKNHGALSEGLAQLVVDRLTACWSATGGRSATFVWFVITLVMIAASAQVITGGALLLLPKENRIATFACPVAVLLLTLPFAAHVRKRRLRALFGKTDVKAGRLWPGALIATLFGYATLIGALRLSDPGRNGSQEPYDFEQGWREGIVTADRVLHGLPPSPPPPPVARPIVPPPSTVHNPQPRPAPPPAAKPHG